MALTKEVYELTRSFPSDERFALTQQINRCAVSIPSNIAEGAGRHTKGDFSHFISIALGSSFELETQLILSGDLKYATEKELKPLQEKLTSLQKMITRFKETLS